MVKGCAGMIVAFLPLCKSCFLQCKSGKTPSLELRDGIGHAKYNTTTSKIEFPPGVPKSRLPGNRRPKEPKETRKGLMLQMGSGTVALVSLGAEEPTGGEIVPWIPYSSSFAFMESVVPGNPAEANSRGAAVKCLIAGSGLRMTFFVDSGAG
jgi:hypothetical protein